MTEPRGNAVSNPVIKARQTELRRDDKETEQQENRRPVDIRDNVAGGDAGKDHHGNRPQQNDAHPIELQSWHAPYRDAEISDGEDRENGRFGMDLDRSERQQRFHLVVNPNAASAACMDS